jgi:transcriptional regulator, tetR family
MVTKLSDRRGDRMSDFTGYELTHKNIVDSGIKHFLKYGYERSNLRKICKDAGVTTGAFYRHFQDKEDLFVSLVQPLADEILGFYSKFEKESFESLDKDRANKLAEINVYGSIESALYMFQKRELFELLIYKAYGTKYDNFVEKLVSLEDQNRKKTMQIISKKKGEYIEIPEEAIHLLDHAYINALCEIVVHSKSEDKVRMNSNIVAEFFNEGWRKLRGF